MFTEPGAVTVSAVGGAVRSNCCVRMETASAPEVELAKPESPL